MHIRQGQGSRNKKHVRVDAGGQGVWYLGFFFTILNNTWLLSYLEYLLQKNY